MLARASISVFSRQPIRAVVLARTYASGTAGESVSSPFPHFDNVKLTLSEQKGTTILTMCRAPVNSLNLGLITDITNAIKASENDKATKALIITSQNPKVFSAGLDITEMHRPNPERFSGFWSSLQHLWLTLYGSKLPIVACINGASPAGGCLIAMGCDYRVMTEGNFSIGLNEAKLGLFVPDFFRQALLNTVGNRRGEIMMSLGQLLPTAEALKHGLIDESAPADQVLARSLAMAKEYSGIPSAARAAIKLDCRRASLERLESTLDECYESAKVGVLNEQTQATLDAYMVQLQARKK
eukprot:CFRG1493T1